MKGVKEYMKLPYNYIINHINDEKFEKSIVQIKNKHSSKK